MAYQVTLEQLGPKILAAASRTARPGEIPMVFKQELDKVWAFLRQTPELRTDGHNIFLYHHVENPADGVLVDFGVEVVQTFRNAGEVKCVATPAGSAAQVIHRGAYSGLPAAHAALHQWCAANGRKIGDYSLEIYGDPTPDPAQTETTIQYLLK